MPESAGQVNIVLSVNKANFSAAMADAQRQLDAFAGKSKAAGHGTVSSMQAASASIRLLENPLGNNIRAIERLISQSQLLSSVMRTAFPVVGAIAIGSAIFKAGEEVAKFVEKMNGMPRAIEQGFGSLVLSARTSNDELDLTNAKLQQEINKLEGKPQNNLKEALYESRIEADKLATSLGTDSKAVNDLLTANKVGLLGQLIGKAPTASVSSSVMSYMNDLQALGNKLSDAAQKPNNDAEVNSLKAQIKAKQDSGLSWAKSKLFVTDNPQYAGPDDDIMGGDQASNRAILLGFQGILGGEQHRQTSEDTNKQLQGQHDKDEQAKTAAEAAKAAARAALEAQKQAARDQLEQWESDNSDWKAAQDRSLADDANWWQAKLDTLTTKSLNYRAVNKKVNADRIADQREWDKQVDTATESYLKDGDDRDWLSKSDTDYITQQGKAATEWIKALSQAPEIQRQTSDAIAESSLRMAVATGQMTKLDAAQVQANMHTAQYAEQLQALNDARDAVMSDTSLTDIQRKAQIAPIDNKIAALNGTRAVQVDEDRQATNPQGSLASTGFVDALDDFVTASKDAAGQMRELVTGSLRSVNDEIVKGLSGQRTNWGNVGAGIFRNVASTGLQKAEGSALSLLGFGAGKPDGSQGKPLYVRFADATQNAASTAGNWLSKLFQGGASTSQSSGSGGGFLSGLGSLVTTALPMLASGGPLSSGTMAIVGEQGPELFMPTTSGNVIPNNSLSSLGGDTNHHWHIDARGATDPAQVRYQVMQGIAQAAPHISAASNKAAQEARKRTPSSSQR